MAAETAAETAAGHEFDFLSSSQRSCINLGKTQPCVRKAIGLLQLLSNRVHLQPPESTEHRGLYVEGKTTPQSYWEVAIAKAVDLILRMEKDRQDTLLKLAEEQERVSYLSQKYDIEAKKRLDSLEFAVQAEQENSTEVLKELQSTSDKERKSLSDALCDLSVIDARHSQLEKNKDELLHNIKLLEEKTYDEQQKKAMILQLQEKCSCELSLAKKSLMEIEEQVFLTNKQAGSDERHREEKLAIARRCLRRNGQKLKDEEKRVEELHATIVRCQEEIVQSQRKEQEFEVSATMGTKEIEIIHDEVCGLQVECNKAEDITKQAEDHNKHLRLKWQEECEMLKAVNTEHRAAIDRAQQSILDLKDKREQTEQEIDRISEEISHCRKQQEDDKKAVDRGNNELIRQEKQLDLSNKQFLKLKKLNDDLCAHFEEEMARIESAEYKLNEAVENIKRKIRETDGINMQLKILERERNEKLKVVEEATETMATELKRTVETNDVVNSQISREVDEIESLCARQKKTIGNLQNQVDRILEEYQTAVDTIGATAKEMDELVSKLQDELTEKQDMSENLRKRKQLLQERIEELNKATVSTEKMKYDVSTENQHLEEEVNRLDEEVNVEMEKETSLDQELIDIREFRTEAQEKLEQYKERRQCHIKSLREDLLSSLSHNEQLRQQFETLQEEYVALKSRLCKDMADKGDGTETAGNLSQLCQIQSQLSWQLEIGSEHTSHLCAGMLVSCQRMQERNNVYLRNIHSNLKEQLQMKPKEL